MTSFRRSHLKKIFLIFPILLLSLSFVSAQNLNLGGTDLPDVEVPETEVPEVDVPEMEVPEMEMPDTGNFPVGKWLDANYDAIWSFSSGNIQLFKEGELIFDFKDKMEGFDIAGSANGVTLKFRTAETARSYEFVKGVTNRDMTLIIDKDNGVHYETLMKMQ